MANTNSNSVASFLTKLLRPDKKDKERQCLDNKRRHSAPVPDWYEIIDAPSNQDNNQKHSRKQKEQNIKYASQQNLAVSKRSKNAKSKQRTNVSKRQSAGFPSWFCVSGNTDTLDRAPLPLGENGNKGNKSSGQKEFSNGKVEMIHQNQGKNSRVKENKYSASPVGGTSRKVKPSSGYSDFNDKSAVKPPRREVSPGVKYRTDGTLEKPYVFPAGLTFGPEGRKLQLRRTILSQVSEGLSYSTHSHEKTVKVDVHSSSTENIIMEYSYEDAHSNLGEFDVRKAFYLKYDSDYSDTKNNECSVDMNDNNRHDTARFSTERSQIHNVDVKDWQGDIHFLTQNEITNCRSDNIKQKNSKAKETHRYSMPPNNEDCVYMGSFENEQISHDLHNKKAASKSSVSVSENVRRSKRDNTRTRKNRYSMPTRNSDLVYMGSFENVNQFLSDNTSGVLSLSPFNNDTNETSGKYPHKNGGKCRRSSESQLVDQPKKRMDAANRMEASVISGYTFNREYGSNHPTSDFKPTANDGKKESIYKRFSTTDLAIPTNLRIVGTTSGKNVSMISADEESDALDTSSFSSGSMQFKNDNNPFSTRRGRSSCMPGNSRFIAPPPALSTPYIVTSPNVAASNTETSCMSSFMTGKKRFCLPPPPNYTPPKEEMEFAYGRLKEMNCHKGSQTDLSIDLEELTMEDRDPTLKRENFKTMFAGTAAQASTAITDLNVTINKTGHPYLQDQELRNTSLNMESSSHVLDVSDVSHGSDEVFQDSQISTNDDTEHRKPGRFTKLRSKTYNDLEESKVTIPSPHSYRKELFKANFHSKNELAHRRTESDISLKNTSKEKLTSTPTRSWRPQPQIPRNKAILAPPDKPTPPPRKTCHPDRTVTPTFTCHLPQPIPQQRHSLVHSRSISTPHTYETISPGTETRDQQTHSRQSVRRSQSCDQSSVLQKQQHNDSAGATTKDLTENIHVSINEEHIYDDIDSQQSAHELDRSICENIYEECGENASEASENTFQKNQTQKCPVKSEKQRLETSLSPLKAIPLSVSPGQRRRNMNSQKETPTSNFPISLSHITSESPVSGVESGIVAKFSEKCQYDESDDNSSIADDEMSLSNDEDMESIDKRYSLRRCVSADNLLRSGSILDRSMILAKRRRKRLREQRSKSHMQLFTDTKLNLDNTPMKIHYTKRKRTSKERLFKQKPSHTDSGHDSEIVSPCTSPDTRRHGDNKTPFSSMNTSRDLTDSGAFCQGTLPRKSWEIRLRNTHNLRKCRSKESLITSTAKTLTTANCPFEGRY